MTQAPATTSPGSGSPLRSRQPLWAGPLVAGLAFGLAYGITHRLVTVNVGELIRFGQGFDVQVFPGTTLESLRLRFGADASQLRGTLELKQLERDPAAEQGNGDVKSDPATDETPEALNDDPSLEPTPEEAAGVEPEPGGPSSPAAPPAPPQLPRP